MAWDFVRAESEFHSVACGSFDMAVGIATQGI